MKKILFSVFIGLLGYWVIGLLAPSPVSAAPCPPLGTNIAANFDRENLEWIAQNANCTGPIPITVIITPAMVQNPDILIDIQNNLGELNFNPTWRPWGFVDPDNTQELNAWLNVFSYLEIGQLQAWNEWNRYKEAGTLDPARDAQVIQALINARNAGLIKVPIGNTPLDLLNVLDMNYERYWKLFFEECPDCIDQLDFIVSNVYPHIRFDPNNPNASVDAFLRVWRGELNFLKNLGVNLDNKFFIISEAGLAPGAYANFEERLRDTLLFAQALENYILSHSGEFPDLNQITFLLMNDNTGEIFLIYRHCDESGCKWLVRGLLAINWNVPGNLFSPFSSLTCTPESSGARDSRPDFCDPCNRTGYLSSSCATTFTAHDEVSYEKREGGPDEPYCVEKDWGGMVVIDPSDVKIPFVGKKREDNINAREDEQKYLADYFEGTDEYYRTYDEQVGIPFFGGKTAFHGTNITLLPNYQGVFRKLTPMGYQDQLKIEMVERAKKQTSELVPGGVHDYQVSYTPRICWDLPFFGDVVSGFARSIAGEMELDLGPIEINASDYFSFLARISHYCLYNFRGSNPVENAKLNAAQTAINTFNNTVSLLGPLGNLFKIQTEGIVDFGDDNNKKTLTQIDGHFPPEPDEENYAQKWRNWKNSNWGKIWEAVPMFSRNDTPGEIAPYLGRKSADQPEYIPPQIEKVPHLARLFEETLELNELLLPQGTAGAPKFVQEKSKPVFASAEPNVLGEKTYLAQGNGSGCFHIEPFSQVHFQPDNSALVFVTIKVHSDGGDGHIQLHINGASQGKMWGWNRAGGPFVINPEYTQSPIAIPLGSCASINYGVRIDECGDAKWQNTTCNFCLEAEGSLVTNCGPGEALEQEVCEIWGPIPVADCFKEAIKDTNPNDDLCCEPINVDLEAVDAFINKQYLPCGTPEGQYDCKTIEVIPGVFEEECKDHCHDVIIEPVNRRFGINLAHPYLNEIWNLSTNSETFGIFNIFRPAQIPQFEDLDASSEITYSYCKESILGICVEKGTVIPETGEFYFNHLGGVQKAKEWVTTKVLMPYIEQ